MMKLPTRKVCGKVIEGVPMVRIIVTEQHYWYGLVEVAKHREGSYPLNKVRTVTA